MVKQIKLRPSTKEESDQCSGNPPPNEALSDELSVTGSTIQILPSILSPEKNGRKKTGNKSKKLKKVRFLVESVDWGANLANMFIDPSLDKVNEQKELKCMTQFSNSRPLNEIENKGEQHPNGGEQDHDLHRTKVREGPKNSFEVGEVCAEKDFSSTGKMEENSCTARHDDEKEPSFNNTNAEANEGRHDHHETDSSNLKVTMSPGIVKVGKVHGSSAGNCRNTVMKYEKLREELSNPEQTPTKPAIDASCKENETSSGKANKLPRRIISIVKVPSPTKKGSRPSVGKKEKKFRNLETKLPPIKGPCCCDQSYSCLQTPLRKKSTLQNDAHSEKIPRPGIKFWFPRLNEVTTNIGKRVKNRRRCDEEGTEYYISDTTAHCIILAYWIRLLQGYIVSAGQVSLEIEE